MSEFERSPFRKEIQEYEQEEPKWSALRQKFEDRKLSGWVCPHCGKRTMTYVLSAGSYSIRCNDCRRYTERRGKPDWAKDAPQDEPHKVD